MGRDFELPFGPLRLHSVRSLRWEGSAMTDKSFVPDAALDRLWRTARSFDDYTAQPVTDTDLRALYELAKWGPTTANSQPQRVVFVRSAEGKAKLEPALS